MGFLRTGIKDGIISVLTEDDIAVPDGVADSTARLALRGFPRGARVYQTDNGFWYELTNAAAPSDAASWAIQRPVQTAVLEADFPKTNDTFANVTDLTLTGLLAGHWYYVTCNVTIAAGGAVPAVMDLNGGNATVTGMQLSGLFQEDGVIGTSTFTALTDAITGGVGFTTIFIFSGVIQVNGAGTLIPRFKQNTTNATASNLNKYATIQAIDVTPE